MAGEGGVFEVHGQVTIEGKPFVLTSIDEKPFGQLTPQESIALGVRAISAGIEAERDAGMIRFLQSIDFDIEAINAMLTGLREYREQYDPPEGLGN
jgi:hypothetical protein